MKKLLLLTTLLLSITAQAGGDYILLWQRLNHATDNDAWWISRMESYAGPRTTDVPEEVYEDVDGSLITNAAHTVTNWNASWVGGTTTNDTQYIKDGINFKVMCLSNYLEREVRPNGDIISSRSRANFVENAKLTSAKLNVLLQGENPHRGGAVVANVNAPAAFVAEGFTIIHPDNP